MLFRLAGRNWLSLALLCAILVPGRGAFAHGAPDDTLATSRDAAVSQVFNGILGYARWPAGVLAPDTLRVCIVGTPVHAGFIGYHTGLIDGRQVTVYRRTSADLPDLCNVVYAGALAAAERDIFVRGLVGKPVLVISERTENCNVASMFCLAPADRRVTFEINLDAVARSGIRIHPRVLKLARPQVRP